MDKVIDRVTVQGLIQNFNLGSVRWWPGSGIQRLFKLPNAWPHHGWWWWPHHGWWRRKSLISRCSKILHFRAYVAWKDLGRDRSYFMKKLSFNIYFRLSERSWCPMALCTMKISLNYLWLFLVIFGHEYLNDLRIGYFAGFLIVWCGSSCIDNLRC